MRKWLLTVFLCVLFYPTASAHAQVDFGFMQGPWNKFAQPFQSPRTRDGKVVHRRPIGAPPPNKRCGYWLMQKFGKSDRRLWRAYAWKTEGRPSNGSVGDVAVMRRSHVGYVSGHCSGGGIQLTSYGNSRIGVFTKCYPRSAFQAFRRV